MRGKDKQMIEFAREIQKHIQNQNITRLAKETNIDRTLLQKIIKGERNPSKEADVVRLGHALMLSPENSKRLLEIYKIEKLGRGNYNRRIMVKDLFEMLIPSSPTLKISEQTVIQKEEQIINNNVICGTNYVIFMTKELLKRSRIKNSSEILISMQPECKDFITMLKCVFFGWGGLDLKISHLIYMQQEVSKDADNIYNLMILKNIMPLIFYGNSYTPYCIYDVPAINANIAPYYIITEDFVVNYSHDFSEAIIFTEKDTIAFYTEQFKRLRRDSFSIIQLMNQQMCEFLHLSFSKEYFMEKETLSLTTISAVPCLGYFITEEMMEKHIYKEFPERDKLMDEMKNRYEILETKKLCHTIIFTKEGMEDFFENGRFGDIPYEIYKPLEKKYRLEILEASYESFRNEMTIFYLVDSEKFNLSKAFSVSVYEGLKSLLWLGMPTDGIHHLALKESSINHAICDFTQSLTSSEYVLSREETKLYFKQMIRNMKTMIDSIE